MSKSTFSVIVVFSIFYMTSCVSCTRTTDCKDKHPITEALSNPRSLVDKYLDRYVPSFGTESLRNRRDHKDKLLTIVSDEAEKNYALIADSLNRGNKKHGNQQSGYAPEGGVKNEGGYGGNAGGGYGGNSGGGYGGNSGGGYGGNAGGGYGDGGSYPEPNPGYGGSGYDDPMVGHGNPSGGKGHNNKGGGYGSGEEEFGTGYAENPEPRAPGSPGGYGSASSGNGKFVIGDNDKRINVG